MTESVATMFHANIGWSDADALAHFRLLREAAATQGADKPVALLIVVIATSSARKDEHLPLSLGTLPPNLERAEVYAGAIAEVASRSLNALLDQLTGESHG